MTIYFSQTFSNNGNEDLKTAKNRTKISLTEGPKEHISGTQLK